MAPPLAMSNPLLYKGLQLRGRDFPELFLHFAVLGIGPKRPASIPKVSHVPFSPSPSVLRFADSGRAVCGLFRVTAIGAPALSLQDRR